MIPVQGVWSWMTFRTGPYQTFGARMAGKIRWAGRLASPGSGGRTDEPMMSAPVSRRQIPNLKFLQLDWLGP